MITPSPRKRGAITLTTTLLLVLMTLLCVLYAHRSLLLEQRIAAHHTRAAQALSLAESGAAWAMARLNDTTRMHPGHGGSCAASSAPGAQAFRAWYAPTTASADSITHGHRAVTNARAACTMADDGDLQCVCALPGSAPALPGGTAQIFEARFSAEPADASVLRLTVVACIHGRQSCGVDDSNGSGAPRATNASNTSDAVARVTMLVKRVPWLRALPRAALTAGGEIQACGATRLVNTGAATDGLLAQAGGNVLTSNCTDTAAVQRPTAWHNTSMGDATRAVVAQDQGLRQASATPLQWFSAWLVDGEPQPGAGFCWINGASAVERGQRLVAAYQRAHRPCEHFWVVGDIDVSESSTLGRAANPSDPQPAAQPVLIMASGAVRLQSGVQVQGLVLSGGDAVQPVARDARVQGALAARGRVVAGMQGEIHHDPATLAALAASGPYVMVPGSWIDE
jgi:hypothetical protein